MEKYKGVSESFRYVYLITIVLMVLVLILFNVLIFYFSALLGIFILGDFLLLLGFAAISVIFYSIISFVVQVEKDKITIKITGSVLTIPFGKIKKVNIVTNKRDGTNIILIVVGNKVKVNSLVSFIGHLIGKFRIVEENSETKIMIKVLEIQDLYHCLHKKIGGNND